MNKKIIMVFSLLLLGNSAVAAEFYVSASGSGNSCLKSKPCSSIQAAINLAQAGDTVKIGEGTFTENITIAGGKAGLTLKGAGADSTMIVSAGGDVAPKFAPPGVPVDIVIDIFSSDVTIEKLSTLHPAMEATKRDLGIFVRPPANNVTIKKCKLVRMRTGTNLEPFMPGSRGILVFRAKGTLIKKNELSGNYEDHLHIPASNTRIIKNEVKDATRIGIVIIQENAASDSTNNVISKNEVEGSGTDGIQIQGDNNIISKNEVEHSGAAGIRLCGAGDCVAPGTVAIASGNQVRNNELEDNSAGNLVDNGAGNIID
ncbi:hypothetical protein MNBD_GAMMA23-2537 [hydrothermal vent metagenome]|uniref:Right handed beta helix domain-containing protein n=1 Tax=hydrothermal vent metagenome TaxID=652676 RepID=A0A3B0ZLJ8_9ZZZZ